MSQAILTLADDTDFANFRVGDPVQSAARYVKTSDTFTSFNPQDISTLTGWSEGTGPVPIGPGEVYWDLGEVTTFSVVRDSQGLYISDDGTTWGFQTGNLGTGGNYEGTARYVYMAGSSAGWSLSSDGAFVTVIAIGPSNTLSVSGGTWNNGETVTGPATTPATGTVASASGNTMTLSASDETYPKRWIVNAGKTVVGPTGPATRFDAYLTWSGNQVTGLSASDPGYFQAPPDLELTFTDPAPSGQTWDQELPAGTTIQTRVKATNASGEANSGWTNVVTPRFLSASHASEAEHCYGEACVRFATFENRAAVYQGEQAMAERESG